MGPRGHMHEVPPERGGEAGCQISLPPVTHSVSLPPFGIDYCLVLSCKEHRWANYWLQPCRGIWAAVLKAQSEVLFIGIISGACSKCKFLRWSCGTGFLLSEEG